MKQEHEIRCGDAFDLAGNLDPNSVDAIITSPPYWAKRIYMGDGEIGTESSPDAYIRRIAGFFDIVRPALKIQGNLFVNMGDTYFGSGSGAEKNHDPKDVSHTRRKERFVPDKPLQPKIPKDGKLFQNKQLMLIPSRFAIEMQDRGWILREDIIWHKPNRIPSGVSDRTINVYEHVFHFVKSNRYFYDLDAIKVPSASGIPKNPGDVWSINTQGLRGTHTATFPEKLAERLVLCGSPEGGTVLDPFIGSGTVWIVCERLNRKCIGFEISEEYIKEAEDRFRKSKPDYGMFEYMDYYCGDEDGNAVH